MPLVVDTETPCPRCGCFTMYKESVMNSLSRKDNQTYICNRCGDEEAFDDAVRSRFFISKKIKDINSI